MMINFYFDGSFEGLLTAIYDAYYRRETSCRILSEKNIQQSICDKNVFIRTDNEKSTKVYNAINKKISNSALKNVYHAYLSELDDISEYIFEYLKMGFKVGKSVDLFLSDDRVLKIHSASQKVTRECHRMLGLLRFRKLDSDFYYAAFSPDYNITILLCPHFKERLSDQNWVVHDLKRNFAGIYNKEECIFIDLPSEFQHQTNINGDSFEALWKEYFKNICIKERINLKLHKQFVPIRYWKYLIEKQD